jgi:acyl carrier protein
MVAQMDTIAKVIRTYIAENIIFDSGNYPYPDDASFLDQGIVDSMNLLGLVTFVEEQFGIKVDSRDIVPENFDSVSRLAAYVEKMKAQAH